MGAIITRREYTNEFRAEKTSWLLGNVGDRITLELDVEVEIQTVSSYSNTITSDGTSEFVRATGSFLEDGFTNGGNIAWSTTVDTGGGPNSEIGTGTITLLTPTRMRVSLTSGVFPSAYAFPFTDGTITTTPLTIESTDNVEGVVFNYNLIENADLSSGSLNSLIDGTTPRFEVTGIDPMDLVTVNTMESLGFKSGHSVFNATIQGDGVSGITQSFKIVVEFQIIPLFDDLSDFQNNTAPSFLFDNASLTDIFKLSFLPEINNPNVLITTDSSETAFDGNVGWFDENFNGGANNYSVVGVSYTNTSGASVQTISKDEPTNFQIVIEQTGATATSKYKIGFISVPFDKTLIQENEQTNYQNLLLNDLGQTINQGTAQFTSSGFANASGASMDIRFDSITNNGTTVYINGQFQPNNNFSLYFDSINKSNWNYVVLLSVADETLASNLSDRVTLLCDFNQLASVETPFVLGDLTTGFLNHAQGIDNSVESVYLGSVEDEVLTQSLMFLDTSKNESIDSISFIVEGFNTVNGETFECENYSIDTTGFVVDGDGVQLLSVDTTRGFQMASGVDKNLIQIERDQTEDVGTKKAYWLRYAIRPRWEYWIENSNVPNELTDATKQFDGKNQNWARLDSFLNDWRLRFSIQTDLNSDGESLKTKNSKSIYVRTYDESDIWDGTVNHYNEAKTVNLNTGLNPDGINTNAILSDENTLIEVDFDLEDTFGDVGNISDYYGVIRIEVFEQGGINGIEMISTVLDNVNGILKPVSGSTKCKIEKISSTKVRLSALIDYNELGSGVFEYKTSGRIGYKNLTMLGIYGSQYGAQYG